MFGASILTLGGLAGSALGLIGSIVLGIMLWGSHRDVSTLTARIDGPMGYVKQLAACNSNLTTARDNETRLKSALDDQNMQIAMVAAEGTRLKTEADTAVKSLASARANAAVLRTVILNMKSTGIPVLDARLKILMAVQ